MQLSAPLPRSASCGRQHSGQRRTGFGVSARAQVSALLLKHWELEQDGQLEQMGEPFGGFVVLF